MTTRKTAMSVFQFVLSSNGLASVQDLIDTYGMSAKTAERYLKDVAAVQTPDYKCNCKKQRRNLSPTVGEKREKMLNQSPANVSDDLIYKTHCEAFQ
jgi:hypothetical protein